MKVRYLYRTYIVELFIITLVKIKIVK
jgi:hypothetical protein